VKNATVIWDQRASSPRACILACRSINSYILTEFLTRGCVPIGIEGVGAAKKTVVVSAYFAGDEACPPPEIIALVEHCKKMNLPIIIGCDANAHHVIWGSSDVNQRGESLLEFILNNNLEILNVGNIPTFVTGVRSKVLDITLSSRSVASHISDCHVSPEESMSDHRIIRFSKGLNLECSERRRNPRNTNWEGFNAFLLRDPVTRVTGKLRTTLELEATVQDIYSCLTNAFRENCSLGRAKRDKDAPWWNDQLEKLRKATRRLFIGQLLYYRKKGET